MKIHQFSIIVCAFSFLRQTVSDTTDQSKELNKEESLQGKDSTTELPELKKNQHFSFELSYNKKHKKQDHKQEYSSLRHEGRSKKRNLALLNTTTEKNIKLTTTLQSTEEKVKNSIKLKKKIRKLKVEPQKKSRKATPRINNTTESTLPFQTDLNTLDNTHEEANKTDSTDDFGIDGEDIAESTTITTLSTLSLKEFVEMLESQSRSPELINEDISTTEALVKSERKKKKKLTTSTTTIAPEEEFSTILNVSEIPSKASESKSRTLIKLTYKKPSIHIKNHSTPLPPAVVFKAKPSKPHGRGNHTTSEKYIKLNGKKSQINKNKTQAQKSKENKLNESLDPLSSNTKVNITINATETEDTIIKLEPDERTLVGNETETEVNGKTLSPEKLNASTKQESSEHISGTQTIPVTCDCTCFFSNNSKLFKQQAGCGERYVHRSYYTSSPIPAAQRYRSHFPFQFLTRCPDQNIIRKLARSSVPGRHHFGGKNHRGHHVGYSRTHHFPLFGSGQRQNIIQNFERRNSLEQPEVRSVRCMPYESNWPYYGNEPNDDDYDDDDDNSWRIGHEHVTFMNSLHKECSPNQVLKTFCQTLHKNTRTRDKIKPKKCVCNCSDRKKRSKTKRLLVEENDLSEICTTVGQKDLTTTTTSPEPDYEDISKLNIEKYDHNDDFAYYDDLYDETPKPTYWDAPISDYYLRNPIYAPYPYPAAPVYYYRDLLSPRLRPAEVVPLIIGPQENQLSIPEQRTPVIMPVAGSANEDQPSHHYLNVELPQHLQETNIKIPPQDEKLSTAKPPGLVKFSNEINQRNPVQKQYPASHAPTPLLNDQQLSKYHKPTNLFVPVQDSPPSPTANKLFTPVWYKTPGQSFSSNLRMGLSKDLDVCKAFCSYCHLKWGENCATYCTRKSEAMKEDEMDQMLCRKCNQSWQPLCKDFCVVSKGEVTVVTGATYSCSKPTQTTLKAQ